MRRFRYRRSRRAEPASLLLEAVLAAATAGVALALIAPMFARQIEMARRARDLDQLEALVNKDINAISQYARLWRLSSGPNTYPNFSITTQTYASNSPISSYTNFGSACNQKSTYNLLFISDLAQYQNLPGTEMNNRPASLGLRQTMALPQSLASRYRLVRSLDEVNTPSQPTVRLSYTLELAEPTAPVLAFHRAAEFHRSAQFWC
jgi:hypothetical protein